MTDLATIIRNDDDKDKQLTTARVCLRRIPDHGDFTNYEVAFTGKETRLENVLLPPHVSLPRQATEFFELFRNSAPTVSTVHDNLGKDAPPFLGPYRLETYWV